MTAQFSMESLLTVLHILRWHEVSALCPDRGILQYACGNDECTWCYDPTLDLSGVLRPYASGCFGWTILAKLLSTLVDPDVRRTLLGSGGGAFRPEQFNMDELLKDDTEGLILTTKILGFEIYKFILATYM